MSGLSAQERGDLVEALLPDAAGMVVDVHEGSADDIAARLQGLSRHELEAVAVILAGMADPDKTLREVLGWVDFDESGAPLGREPAPIVESVRDTARGRVKAGQVVDEVAVRRALEAGPPVRLNQAERRMAVVVGVRRGLTHEEIASRLGMTKSAVQQVWERVKKRARDEGQPVVPFRRAS